MYITSLLPSKHAVMRYMCIICVCTQYYIDYGFSAPIPPHLLLIYGREKR